MQRIALPCQRTHPTGGLVGGCGPYDFHSWLQRQTRLPSQITVWVGMRRTQLRFLGGLRPAALARPMAPCQSSHAAATPQVILSTIEATELVRTLDLGSTPTLARDTLSQQKQCIH